MQIPTAYIQSYYNQFDYNYANRIDNGYVNHGVETCEICDNRQYMDKSADATVSFQTPTKMNPGKAAHMVAAHEQEHIRNDRLSAEQNGHEVVFQSVRLNYDICRECGVTYVAGGEATTISKSTDSTEFSDFFNVGIENIIGDLLDLEI